MNGNFTGCFAHAPVAKTLVTWLFLAAREAGATLTEALRPAGTEKGENGHWAVEGAVISFMQV